MNIQWGSVGQWLGGGFLGAVLSLSIGWYLTRPTTITYSLTTTSLGADSTVKGIVPDLKLQIGTEEIPAVHTHTVQLSAISGRYVDKAELAIQWDKPVRLYGKPSTDTPSLSHQISCRQEQIGVTCSLTPITKNQERPYRISLATDQPAAPTIHLVGKDVELVRAEATAGRFDDWKVHALISMLAIFLAIVLSNTWMMRTARDRLDTRLLDALQAADKRRTKS